MKLTPEEVKHIAKLARLQLTETEIEKFSTQLSDILSYTTLLNEVNTDGIEPIAQITGEKNVLFPDQLDAFEKTDELLAQSPQQIQGHMIKVKNVFE